MLSWYLTLHRKVNDHNEEASRKGGIVIAWGMAVYENDRCVAPVFERADQNMYDDKARLKENRPIRT